MNKKLFGTLLLGSLLMGGTFVSCKDYDDDIDNLQKQIESHATAISQLQSAVASLSYVTNVAKNGDGIDVTFSNGTTTTIKTIKGENGQDGKDGSVVTIGENGNWAIDGEDTGVSAKGEAGKSPVIGEDGCWAVYNAETKEYESTGVLAAAAGTVAESSDGLAYEITLKNADGENVVVKVPAVAVITNVTAYSFNDESFDNGNLKDHAWVSKITSVKTFDVYYGIVAADVAFNGKTYKKGATISGLGSTICAETSPLQVDATAYQWELSDSKSGSIVEIANVQEFKTVNALTTRGATANPGFYKFSIKLKDGIGNKEIVGDSIKYTDWDGNATSSAKVYALKTKDYQGNIISSDYCYKIAPAKVKDITIYAIATTAVVNKAYDMFNNALYGIYTKVNHYDGTEKGGGSSAAYLIADCTFEFPQDQTAKKEALGASINGNTITAAKPGTITVKAKYLTIEGKKGETTFQVTFETAATTSSISDFNWSVQANNPNTTADETVVSNVVTGLDKYLSSANYVTVVSETVSNGVKEQKLDLTNESDISFKYNPALQDNPDPTGIDAALYKITDQNGYVSYEMRLKFDPSTVRPNPVVGTLKFNRMNDNYPEMTVSFKVNVTDAQRFDFKPKAAYFNGTEAIAYGIADGTNITSNIFDFFDIAGDDVKNIVIKEIVPQYTDVNGNAHDVAPWTGAKKDSEGNYTIGSVGSTAKTAGKFTVEKWNVNGTYSDPNGTYVVDPNKGNYGAYSDASRKFVIYYYPNGNTSVKAISYEFGVTIKSIIAEGTMKYVKPTITKDDGGNITNVTYADGETVEVVGADAPTIDLIKNFTCKDANNAEFHLVDGTDNWGSTVTTYPNKTATTLQNNYKTVLGTEVEDALKPYVTATVADGKIKFERVDNTVVIVNPVSGKVALTVTDNWGRTTKVEVPVTVK